jgi:hypothetical protein
MEIVLFIGNVFKEDILVILMFSVRKIDKNNIEDCFGFLVISVKVIKIGFKQK